MGSAPSVSCVLAHVKIGALMFFAAAATIVTLVGVFLIAALEIRIHRLEKALKWERQYADNLERQLAKHLEAKRVELV